MYEAFYGLREPPFHVTADPAFLFLSQHHREALDHLTYGVQKRLGFIEITGEVGSGKTTLVKVLVGRLNASTPPFRNLGHPSWMASDKHSSDGHCAYGAVAPRMRGHDSGGAGPTATSVILNPNLSDVQLLEAIVHDFGLTPPRKTRASLMDTLNRFLLEQQREGRTAALIIDEAQTLSPRTLEQVRLLSNLETPKEKLLQIILVGQPELAVKLADSCLKALHQRIAVRYRIQPLAPGEVGEYIAHRLRVAGAEAGHPVFTPEAVEAVARYSQGLPRTINHVCDRALLAGFIHETVTIDLPLVHEAIRTVEGVAETEEEVAYEPDYRRLAESPATSRI